MKKINNDGEIRVELNLVYKDFIYEKYEIEELDNSYKIIYFFDIPDFASFRPSIEIDKKFFSKHNKLSEYMIFNIGMIELISYWKCIMPPNVIVKAGYINDEQINWFKKLYYYGLGEFFYTNDIETNINDFMNITCTCDDSFDYDIQFDGKGALIPIGGGKDSNVTLELLGTKDNVCFMLNPKEVSLECAKIGGFNQDNTITVKRTIDKTLIELNEEGFYNGHTPFSALLAFLTYFIAYQNDKKYIVLSNEGSANEATVLGSDVNHQYSKSYEFECDFNNYVNKFFKIDIKYFSFLRPLSELQIAMLFSKYTKYHNVFKSCNVGSKSNPWKWCCDCGKCLFVYIILSPFLYKDDLVNIFGEDLFEKESLKKIFLELIGSSDTKPFDCVGTIKEVRYALSLTIKKLENSELPYLLQFYKDNYEVDTSEDLLHEYNEENNLNQEFEDILKKALDEYGR